jgi:hypothetical protein
VTPVTRVNCDRKTLGSRRKYEMKSNGEQVTAALEPKTGPLGWMSHIRKELRKLKSTQKRAKKKKKGRDMRDKIGDTTGEGRHQVEIPRDGSAVLAYGSYTG